VNAERALCVVFSLIAARALEWTMPWLLLILSTAHACVTAPRMSTAIFAKAAVAGLDRKFLASAPNISID